MQPKRSLAVAGDSIAAKSNRSSFPSSSAMGLSKASSGRPSSILGLRSGSSLGIQAAKKAKQDITKYTNNTNSFSPSASGHVSSLSVSAKTFNYFSEKQLEEIADVFSLFNFHTHNGLMRGDDLGIALRVLGIDITRDQHRGYLALYSTSETNAKNSAEGGDQPPLGANQSSSESMRRQQELSGKELSSSVAGSTGTTSSNNNTKLSPQEIISKMAKIKGSQNYFTLADFIEVCEDAKEAQLRRGVGINANNNNNNDTGSFSITITDNNRTTAVGGGGGGGINQGFVNSLRTAGKASSNANTNQLDFHKNRWISETFGTFGEPSLTAEGLQKSLEKLLASLEDGGGLRLASVGEGANDGPTRRSETTDGEATGGSGLRGDAFGNGGRVRGGDGVYAGRDNEGSVTMRGSSVATVGPKGIIKQRQQSTAAGSSYSRASSSSSAAAAAAVGVMNDNPSFVFEDDYMNPELNGLLNLDAPSIEEVTAAFRDLGLDPQLGMTCEDLLRVLETSNSIL